MSLDEGFDPIFLISIRLTLALLFATAAAHKIVQGPRFRETLRDYRLLPARLVQFASGLLIVTEVAAVVALLLPAWTRIGLILVVGLLFIYAVAIGFNLLRGRRNIDCGCSAFAPDQPISGALVTRNLALAAPAIIALQEATPRPLNVWDYCIAVCSAVGFFLLYTAINQLLTNTPKLTRLSMRYD